MFKKLIYYTFILFVIIGLFTYGIIYFYQEKLIFHPDKLETNFKYNFEGNYEEQFFKMEDGTQLNGLLFKADSSKGLIFYLHGNAGSLETWGEIASNYTNLNYDIFILDYRGFGKSEGFIRSESQFFDDIEKTYTTFLNKYEANKIVILGYSIGTGAAAYLASKNKPKILILQAPYYSLTDLVKHTVPLIPSFLLKYKFETNKYLKGLKTPIVIFHGDKDEVIYYESSIKLQKEFKYSDRLITLENQYHNGITTNPIYLKELEQILGN